MNRFYEFACVSFEQVIAVRSKGEMSDCRLLRSVGSLTADGDARGYIASGEWAIGNCHVCRHRHVA